MAQMLLNPAGLYMLVRFWHSCVPEVEASGHAWGPRQTKGQFNLQGAHTQPSYVGVHKRTNMRKGS